MRIPKSLAALFCLGITAALVAQTGGSTHAPAAQPPVRAASAVAPAEPNPDAVKYRAMLDKYCVTAIRN